jgi:hypothetical protein
MDPFKFQKISSYSNINCNNILNGCKLLTALQFKVKKYYVSCLNCTMHAWERVSMALVR